MRRFSAAFIFFVAASLLINTSCSDNNKAKDDNRPELTVYAMEYETPLRNLIKQYNSSNNEYVIKEKVYFSDQYNKYSEDLQKGLSEGAGPDIIVTDPNRLPMLSKYIANGCFNVLDDFYKADKAVKKDDYYKEVMNYGIYKGKRYLVPLSFSVDALFTTKDIREKAGVADFHRETGWGDIFRECTNYLNKSKGSDKYLFSGFDFSSMIRGLGKDAIDMESKEANLDTSAVKSLVKLYKTINKCAMPNNLLNQKIKGGDMSAILKNGDALFLNTAIAAPQNLWFNYSAFNTEVEPEVYSVQTENGKINARVVSFAAINSKSIHKKEAYNFISMLLSKDYQLDDALNGIPVSRSAYKQQRDKCISGTDANRNGRGGGCKSDNTIKKLLSYTDDYLNRLDVCKIEDYQVYKLIDEKVNQDISKNITDDNITKDLQETVKNYFQQKLLPGTGKENKAYSVGNNIKAKLSITYMDYNQQIKNVLRRSRELYPGIEFTETVFDNEKYAEMNNKLSAELLAGEGPDIIVFGSGTFNSLYRVVNSGIFSDINDLINTDNGFNKKDYYEKIFDCGIYKNKRLYVPLDYMISYLKTTDLTLKENKIDIKKSSINLDELHKLALDFIKNRQDPGKSLLWCNFGFTSMMRISGEKFIDYEKRKSYINTKEFINLLTAYKEIYPSIAQEDTCIKYKSYADMTKDKKLIMAFDIVSESPELTWSQNSKYNEAVGDDMKIIGIENNGKYFARIGNCVAINSNCKNKKAAFDVMKIMLSKDLQKSKDSHGNSNINISLPVNKQAFIEDINYYMNNTISEFGSEYPSKKLPKKLADRLGSMIANTRPELNLDSAVYKMVNEAVENYIKGKNSAQQTAKMLDEKVSIYLNE